MENSGRRQAGLGEKPNRADSRKHGFWQAVDRRFGGWGIGNDNAGLEILLVNAARPLWHIGVSHVAVRRIDSRFRPKKSLR